MFIRFPCSVFNGNYAVTKQPFSTQEMICLETSLPAVENRYQDIYFKDAVQELFIPLSFVGKSKTNVKNSLHKEANVGGKNPFTCLFT